MREDAIVSHLARHGVPLLLAVGLIAGLLTFTTKAQDNAYRPHGFGPPIQVGSFQTGSGDIILAGDVSGDGLAEWIIFHTQAGPTWGAGDVQIKQPDVLARTLRNLAGTTGFCTGSQIPALADVNGDGYADLIRFVGVSAAEPTRGDVWVSLTTGIGFAPQTKWHESLATAGEEMRMGDVNGDGCADVVLFSEGAVGGVRVALANLAGSFDDPGPPLLVGFAKAGAQVHVADFDGDGLADLASVENGATQRVIVALALLGGGFAPPVTVMEQTGNGQVFFGDVTGDRRADMLRRLSSGPGVSLRAWSGGSFGMERIAHQESGFNERTWFATGRLNADLNADLMTLEFSPGPMLTLETVTAVCAIAGEHAPSRAVNLGEYGYGTMTNGVLPPPIGITEIPVVIICGEFKTAPPFPPGFSTALVEQFVFGPQEPSIDGMIRNASGNHVRLRRAGPGVTPIIRNLDPSPSGTSAHIPAYFAGIQGFDFALFDTNHDGVVQNNELVIISIFNTTDGLGQTDPDVTFDTNIAGDLFRGITISCPIATVSYTALWPVLAHEFCHTLGALDLYGPKIPCYALGTTLMSCSPTVQSPGPGFVMLDAWHRMRLGWQRPRVFDVSTYPAAAVIDVAQINNISSIFQRPPVLLTDAAHADTEFYLLEARSRTWNGGPVFNVGEPGAGYDSDFAGGSNNGSGVAFWSCAVNASGDAYAHIQIGPGQDGVLQTSIAAGSDDQLVGGWISPGPDRITQSLPAYFAGQRITAGTNAVLNSALLGDDTVVGGEITPGVNGILDTLLMGDDVITPDDIGIFPLSIFNSLTPANPATRVLQHLNRSVGSITPRWFDGTTSSLSIAADEGTSSSGQSIVEWSTGEFTPFIDSLRPSRAIPGGSVTINGRLGRNLPGKTKVWLAAGSGYGSRIELPIARWTGESARINLPVDLAYGSWRLLIVRDASVSVLSSNTVILNVSETTLYNKWRSLRVPPQSFIIPTLDFPPYERLLNPFADPDGDGLPNRAEFALGSDPFVAEPSGTFIDQQVISTEGLQLTWQEDLSAVEEVGVVPEYSSDLSVWDELPAFTIGSTKTAQTRGAFLPTGGTESRGFMRLRFGE